MTKRKVMVLMGSVMVLTAACNVFAADPEYVGHSQCRICHNSKDDGEQWNKWKEGPHAGAFEILSSDEAKAVAAEMGLDKPAAEAPQCLKCHVTEYDVETLKTPDRIRLADGVQCESCHGPSSSHIIEGRKYRSGDETADPRALAVHPDVDVCTKCHNEESPTWDPERYTLEDGSTSGFDFEQAWAKIDHSKPE